MMAMHGNRAAWPSNDDFTFLSLAVVVVGLGFFGWIGWTNYHAEISGGVAEVAHWQIGLIRHFTSKLDDLDQTISAADLDAVTLPEILNVLNVIGQYLRFPVIAVILILAALCFARAAPSRFTRNLNLEGLIREQARSFRWTAAFVRRNLRLVPLQPDALRPSDPALHAHEWAARFATDERGAYDPDAATRAFALQLGPPWRGLDQAADHVRVLVAVFALHLDQQRAEAQELLGSLAESLPPGGRHEAAGPQRPYDVSQALAGAADMVLQSETLRERVDQITLAHAYTAPALMSLLTAARRRAGVLAPAQFGALKLIDRNLWYALHSLGVEGDGPGQSSHPNPRVEAAGARDHWAAERAAGRPLVIPSVERAVSAVRTAIDESEASRNTLEVS
jgi:intracellular multiplication protein IcmP